MVTNLSTYVKWKTLDPFHGLRQQGKNLKNFLSMYNVTCWLLSPSLRRGKNLTTPILRGSGNVFFDFGRTNAGLEQARAILAAEIIRTLDARGLSTRDAEKLTGVGHSEFSRIRNAKLDRFTLDRMITILGKLDENVEVSITFHPRRYETHDRPNIR
jgi:predicted XRE-type DNA-binding protein